MTNEQHQVLVMRTAILRTNNKIVIDSGRMARNGLTVILRPHIEIRSRPGWGETSQMGRYFAPEVYKPKLAV